MDVRYLLIARYAEVAPDGSVNLIGAGSDVHLSSALPTALPMLYVVAQVALDMEDVASSHTLKIRVVDPQGGQITETDVINIGAQANVPADREHLGAKIVLGLQNIELKEYGRFLIQLYYDDSVVKRAQLRVDPVQGDAPASTGTQGAEE
jgi:hypothetical protein